MHTYVVFRVRIQHVIFLHNANEAMIYPDNGSEIHNDTKSKYYMHMISMHPELWPMTGTNFGC